jgi:hypothetical protein
MTNLNINELNRLFNTHKNKVETKESTVKQVSLQERLTAILSDETLSSALYCQGVL